MLFFPFFWIYNILKGGNIIKEEYYKDITIHEFCYLFIKKKKTKEVTAIGERKGIKGKEMEEEKFFLYRKRGYRSRNRCKAGNWPRKAVTIESWERTIFPPPPLPLHFEFARHALNTTLLFNLNKRGGALGGASELRSRANLSRFHGC